MIDQRARIVVTGLAATFPLGGVFWDYLQWPLGLVRLGHDVLYVEDTGGWSYAPRSKSFSVSGEPNARLLEQQIDELAPELSDRWFFRDAAGECFGRDAAATARFCETADLLVNVSGTAWLREPYIGARRMAYVDTDPMYTQASFLAYGEGTADPAATARVDGILRHHSFFTFGENIGQPDCGIPDGLVDWRPIRQPVVLDCWRDETASRGSRRQVLTTVASWERGGDEISVGAARYGGKRVELDRFMSVAARSPLPLEIALSGDAPVERFRAAGWRLVDPLAVAGTAAAYRSYLASSFAEWSVAKNAYVDARTGWFSCRSACYLALGVPTIVQDTGFGIALPTDRGIVAFSTVDEATAAIECVASDPGLHEAAAREIAASAFNSDVILSEFLDVALG